MFVLFTETRFYSKTLHTFVMHLILPYKPHGAEALLRS